MKKTIMAVMATLALAGCNSDSDTTITPQSTSPVSVRYANGGMTTATMTGVEAVGDETNIPLLFYGAMVRAYQYGARPVMVGERQNADWSTWNLIPFEVFYLPNGGVADLQTSYEEFSDAQAYIDTVGTFSMDFLVARGEPSLVNINNAVCGANSGGTSPDQPSQYPDLRFGVCQHKYVVSAVDGQPVFQLRAVFARRDWFPATFQIYIGADPNAVEGLQCYETSAPISAFQEEVLTSLMNLELAGAGTEPMFYSPSCLTELVPNQDGLSARSRVDLPVTIIPQSGDLAVAQLSQEAVPQLPAYTDGGEPIPQPDLIITSSSLRAEVGFDLVPSMIVNYDLFNIDDDPSDIILSPGANGAPWGMTLDFIATP